MRETGEALEGGQCTDRWWRVAAKAVKLVLVAAPMGVG